MVVVWKGGWGEWGTGKRAEGERTQNIEMGVQGMIRLLCLCLSGRVEDGNAETISILKPDLSADKSLLDSSTDGRKRQGPQDPGRPVG